LFVEGVVGLPAPPIAGLLVPVLVPAPFSPLLSAPVPLVPALLGGAIVASLDEAGGMLDPTPTPVPSRLAIVCWSGDPVTGSPFFSW
jgi:hypothetical protein